MAPGAGQTLDVAGGIADQDGGWFSLGNTTPEAGNSSDGTPNAGVGTLMIGAGFVQLGTAGTENTFAGPIVVESGGILAIAGDGALGTLDAGDAALGQNVLTLDAGTTLDFLSGFTVDHAIVVSGDPSFTVQPGSIETIGSVIADGATPGTVGSTGAARWCWRRQHFTGGLLLAGGTLDLSARGAAGSGAITFGSS